MIKTFTQNDLIRYIYHETTEEETREIEQALGSETELLEQYNDLQNARQAAANAELQPSQSVISNILNYSANLTVRH